MKVLWAPEAEQDRDDIWDTIEADDPLAAARMDLLFAEAAAKLADFPMLGHVGKILGARELLNEDIQPYWKVIVWEIP